MPKSTHKPASAGRSLILLGGIELRGVPVAVAGRLLAQSKAVALLSFLALSPTGRHQRRDRLVGLLWPELDQAHARTVLRKVVYVVRFELGDGVLVGRGDEELMVASDQLSCDAREFTEHVEAGRLARAVELYGGELMPGFHLNGCAEFGSWLDLQRTNLAQGAAAAAWALAVQLEREDSYTEAGKMARKAMQYDVGDERVLRRAMLMLQRIGDRAGAIRIFEDFTRRLRAELDTDPSAETAALAAAIRKG